MIINENKVLTSIDKALDIDENGVCIIPFGVKAIGDAAFHYCDKLISVILPGSVETIEDHAFRDCINLVSINVPNNVAKIGHYAFSDCYSLKSIILNDNMKNIGEGAFYACQSLKEIKLPEGLKIINPKTFMHSGLEYAYIPNSVSHIGFSAFCNCEFKEFIVPDGIKKIDKVAFDCCLKLERVVMSDSIEEIGDYAFTTCDNLKVVETNRPELLKQITFGYIHDKVKIIPRENKLIDDNFSLAR